jgi:signal recognition particle receptor subunit beta
MKIGETFDNPGNNKFNVVLKIISEEGEVGLIVVSCIKV